MPKNQLNEVLTYLRGKRLVKGKGDLADQLGYHVTYISALFNGKKPVTQAVAEALFNKFSISTEWLINHEGSMVLNDEEVPYITNPNANAKGDAEILRAAAKLMVKYADQLDKGITDDSKKKIKKHGDKNK
jgi:plasmid maintenance system antidote protein VapI